ncbi:MAG: tRNA pseudouridine(38-40) synthase TruA [Kiritimatiellae bacterium]|nr:tRNA pseudouridine(38-40) synthase TruA [Kiritimatiellia bacterium]
MAKTTPSSKHQRYRLNLEFAGTGFSGWQKQDNARTIQGTLLEVGAEIFNDKGLDIQGHGRTDAGVHALNYTAHLETSSETRQTPAAICERFNTLLPSSIAMLSVTPCDPRFHARHTCVGRSYLYQIARRKSAFNKNYSWWPKEQLKVAAMADAAEIFTGMHDFAAFAEKPELKRSTTVLVNGVFIYEDEEMIRVRIVGSHFLWKMVRRIVGVLVEVGRGALSLEQARAFLTAPAGSAAEHTAPAAGLFFEQAFYDREAFERYLATESAEDEL